MNNTTSPAQYALTFEWDEFGGFTAGRATTVRETETVTIAASSATAALVIGRRMLRSYDEGTTLRSVEPA